MNNLQSTYPFDEIGSVQFFICGAEGFVSNPPLNEKEYFNEELRGAFAWTRISPLILN